MTKNNVKPDKVFAEHPQGKNGVWIDATKYESMKTVIIEALNGRELTHTQLLKEVQDNIGDFPGSVSWYMVTVKLDLESKKIVHRFKNGPETFYRLEM